MPGNDEQKSPGIDTGPGGFVVDGRVYSAVLVEQGSGADYDAPLDSYRNDVNVDKRVRDLAPSVKRTLGQYVSDATKGTVGPSTHGNRYPVDAPNGVPDASLRDANGYPSSPRPSTNSAQYTNDLGVEAPAPVGSPTSTVLREGGFKPGGGAGAALDGHTLLSPPGAATRERYVQVLVANNRWSAVSPRGVDPNRPNPNEAVRYYDPGSTMGEVSSLNDDGLGTNLRRGRDIALSRFATVGATLSMRASMELGSLNPGFNPNGGAASAGALLPSFNQLMLERVSTANLRAGDVASSLTEDPVTETTEFNVTDLSWGALNNVNDQFEGLAALGMITTALALSLAVVLAVEGVTALFSLLSSGASGGSVYTDPTGRRFLGAYSFPKPTPSGGIPGLLPLPIDIASMLGIKRTTIPLTKAVNEGVKLFFLGPNKSIDISDFTSSPGFTAVHARNIFRSAITFIDKLKSAFNGSPIDIVKNLLSLIETLRRSKFIAAINVFAIMGERSLNPSVTDSRGKSLTVLDAQDGPAISRDRLPDGISLAWAASQAPELVMLPQFIHTTSGLGAPDAPLVSRTDSRVSLRSGPRIDPGEVAVIEKAYDAEYVPFYFHDLRTNELTGFHAFLESLSESFSPQYETTEGVGRVDGVKTYKSTGRKIDLSFQIVSTSPSDNDEMWRKINKLVTLVYPQFSSGKTLHSADGKYTFKQPFSQLMTSTPLIRLRIGDLIRGNYTRFDLARMFGFGDPSFAMTLDGVDMSSAISNAAAVERAYNDKLASVMGDLTSGAASGYAFMVSPGNYEGLREDFAPTLFLTSTATAGVEFTPVGSNDDYILMRVSLISDPDYKLVRTADLEAATLGGGDHLRPNSDSSKTYVGGTYKIPKAAVICLSPTNKGTKKMRADVASGNTTASDKLNAFLTVSSNAIVGSFYRMGGRGVPGIIESLSFDWGDKQVTWNVEIGKTAPKNCKVSMSFTVLHDLAPGLDHMGANRAPVYPLGPHVHGQDKEVGALDGES